MGDTSERSKTSALPPRCPCGFWGSSKTMNLCSKCFADVQKKQPGEECSSKPLQSSGSGASVFSAEPSPSSSSSSPCSSSSPSKNTTSPLSSQPSSTSEATAATESAFSSSREGEADCLLCSRRLHTTWI